MNVEKIGKFIAGCRKEKGYTQAALAEQLGVSDGAVSKWENGRSLPDAVMMLPLCELLSINVNELLKGERIETEDAERISEELLISLKEMEESKAKQLLLLEKWISVLAGITLAGIYGIAFCISGLYSTLLFGLGSLLLVGCIFLAIWLEQTSGYYQCSACGHTYTAKFWDVFMAPNIGHRRKLRCPNCQTVNYHEKVLHKDH